MAVDFSKVKFSIIKHHNSPTMVELDGELRAYKKEFVQLEHPYGKVVCCPYDNHFVFLDPTPATPKNQRWFALCSCGGPAIVVGTQAYAHLGSPSGWMLACWSHLTYGKHWDGSS